MIDLKKYRTTCTIKTVEAYEPNPSLGRAPYRTQYVTDVICSPLLPSETAGQDQRSRARVFVSALDWEKRVAATVHSPVDRMQFTSSDEFTHSADSNTWTISSVTKYSGGNFDAVYDVELVS